MTEEATAEPTTKDEVAPKEKPVDYDEMWQYIHDRCEAMSKIGITVESKCDWDKNKQKRHSYFTVTYSVDKLKTRIEALKCAETIADSLGLND